MVVPYAGPGQRLSRTTYSYDDQDIPILPRGASINDVIPKGHTVQKYVSPTVIKIVFRKLNRKKSKFLRRVLMGALHKRFVEEGTRMCI